MTNKVTTSILFSDPTAKPPKGKLQRFRDWTSENKKAYAISLLVIGILALCTGLGALVGMIVSAGWFATSFGLSTFLINCFTWSSTTGAVTGLKATGVMMALAAASTLTGVGVTGYATGILLGTPKKGEE